MADGHVDDDGRPHLQGLGEQGAELQGVVGPQADSAEGLGELDEVRVEQVGLVGAAKELIEIARDVAVGVVAEDESDGVNAVLDGRGEIGGGEEKAAVATDAKHLAVGVRHLHAQGGWEGEAEVEGSSRNR